MKYMKYMKSGRGEGGITRGDEGEGGMRFTEWLEGII